MLNENNGVFFRQTEQKTNSIKTKEIVRTNRRIITNFINKLKSNISIAIYRKENNNSNFRRCKKMQNIQSILMEHISIHKTINVKSDIK